MNNNFIELRNITKVFPGVCALDDVSINLQAGEVHAVIGENGAGKSTLMKILSGVFTPTSGRILVDGKEVRISSPRVAQELGISPIFQEMNLVPYLTIGQNIFLGKEPKRGWRVDFAEINRKTSEILSLLGLELDPNLLVKDLGVAQKQMVEIARALMSNSRLVIMDEPTSALGARETEKLFEIINTLKKQGVTILYISHRLEELFAIGDRGTVLRDGRYVDTMNLKQVDRSDLIRMMVGRKIEEVFPREFVTPGDEVLKVRNLNSGKKLHNINLEVREGEIVGIYGLVGAGRTELVQALFGIDSFESGSVEIFGSEMKKISPSESIRKGVGLLPEDRHKNGLCLGLSVKANITKAALKKRFPLGIINPAKESKLAENLVKERNIITPSINKLVGYLSGGNQQKTMLAQLMCVGSRLLVFDEPTRGIDVGAKVEIYHFMNNHVKKGYAVLMISSELPEIIGMSDRIYVMCGGKIVKEFKKGEASQESIMSYAIMGGDDR